MVLIKSINTTAPLLALGAVLLSVAFPGRQKHEVERIARRCEAMSADNEALRAEIVSVLAFLRDYNNASLSDSAAMTEGPSPGYGGDIVGARFMHARGRSGFALGRDWWLEGDSSPWGVVAHAYPGGFESDSGTRYRFTVQAAE